MTRSNALGDHLRARRELVDPASVGLRVAGVRRTPGLRREEVATLAGISADYYLRLEQGRDRNPSPQVLRALARVLQLDTEATRYLMGLAAPEVRRAPRPAAVPAGIRQLLDVLNVPAFVEDRTFDVLAANRLATALWPGLRPGTNRLRAVFLDPDERDLLPDWEHAIGGMVAAFRSSIGTDVDDPRIVRLVGELSLASEPFRRLWARHDVAALAGGPVRLRHPRLGDLELRREKLPIGDTGGQLLVLHHAAPGSASAAALASLAEETGDRQDRAASSR
ncbi:helix-turn-helix domain-containing protein [Pseudonocardia lacus]|uniref:helix-turn-helix domain-containing protein n=1 Tax=Pseudonocardia lacus TaxID=2835865 RepID=UPI001BDCA35B|nr:helix-turn-helix domain-containing protein [Pseudonocardia lacus]